MRKILYCLCLCFIVVTTAVTSYRLSKKERKHKKKHPVPEQVNMRFPTNLPFELIQGQDREKIIKAIKAFPLASYQLFSVPGNGYFYLDLVDDFIKGHLRRGGTWEGHIQNVIHQYAHLGSTVLDIGAHIGTHTLAMAQAVGEEGHVIAFEPQPKLFRELFLNMVINNLRNITFYWAGVGAREGKIELVPLNCSNEGGAGLNGGTGQVVQLLTIDSLHLSNVSLMKIDVEGMEDQVLDGARETILSNRPVIIIEIMGGHDFGKATKEIRQKILHTIDKLEQLGYQVSQLWCHDWIAIPS